MRFYVSSFLIKYKQQHFATNKQIVAKGYGKQKSYISYRKVQLS